MNASLYAAGRAAAKADRLRGIEVAGTVLADDGTLLDDWRAGYRAGLGEPVEAKPCGCTRLVGIIGRAPCVHDTVRVGVPSAAQREAFARTTRKSRTLLARLAVPKWSVRLGGEDRPREDGAA